jgi:hypothetical protein
MARSRISNVTKSLIDDDGSVLLSVVNGEQLHIGVQADWIVNLTGYNIHCRIIEGDNDGNGSKPTQIKSGGQVRLLTEASGHIRNISTNTFKFVIPWDLVLNYSPQPKPDKAVYAYFELEIGEPGTGDTAPVGDSAAPDKQVWKPLRGLIEILYSPTEG